MTSLRIPPRFVPTLTDVVDLPAEDSEDVAKSVGHLKIDSGVAEINHIAVDPAERMDSMASGWLQEQWVESVLHHMDAQLEEQVSDAVASVVQVHIDAMLPQIRREIEIVVRRIAAEAIALEQSKNTGSVPTSGTETLG